MKNNAMISIMIILLAIGAIGGYAYNEKDAGMDEDIIYQYSIIDSLMKGVFDGDLEIGELTSYGDFGLGTFNSLDGEMVVLDGVVYQVRYDGVAYVKEGSSLSPFACVTTFNKDIVIEVEDHMDQSSIEELILSKMPSPNIPYAIRIDGTFDSMTTRSPKPQEKPYPDLVAALADQSVFNFESIDGTIVGFWNPSYVNDVNVPGYHLHFLNQERDSGGHVLDFSIDSGTIYLDCSYGLYLELPTEGAYMQVDLVANSEDLEKAEN